MFMASEVKLMKVEALLPYARNSRAHSEDQVTALAASMREYGFTNPVLIRKDGTIVAGHGRVLAARKLGLDQVPCIDVSHLNEAQMRAYVIADNKLAEQSDWDDEMLALELDDLRAEGFDLDLLGFGQKEIEAMLQPSPLDDMPALPSGDKNPYQALTFTVHDRQAELIKRALDTAKKKGPFEDAINENSNGNALARVCGMFLQAANFKADKE